MPALLDRAPFLVACAMLTAIVLTYGSLQGGVFTLEELNLNTTAALTLMLAASGQTIVLIRGGIDLSIGGMISLGTVFAATQFGTDPVNVGLWSLIILVLGAIASILLSKAAPRRHLYALGSSATVARFSGVPTTPAPQS